MSRVYMQVNIISKMMDDETGFVSFCICGKNKKTDPYIHS